jgi:hypothetical protein
MKAGIQRIFMELGEAGCYFLCIGEISERERGYPIDPVAEFIKAVENRIIRYKYDDPNYEDNCFVDSPDRLLSILTGKKWMCRKVYDINYRPKANERVIQYWERKATGKVYGHFVLSDWDPLGNSLTRKSGSLVSLRVFTLI